MKSTSHCSFFWRLHWQIGRLLPVEDAVEIVGRLSVSTSPGFAPVGHVYRLETMPVPRNGLRE
jgi:hypothetical protein